MTVAPDQNAAESPGETAAPADATAERYTIRRKVFKLFGAGFHIYNSDGAVVGYCRQKAFRLREDLRIYTDESCSQELLRILTPNVIDFSAVYTAQLPSGETIAAFSRRGVKSLLRDTWSVAGPDGAEIGTIREENRTKALLRRANDLVASFIPQQFVFEASDGGEVARYRTHFNPFIHRLGVAPLREDEIFDDLLILAGGCLLSAIEGRQSD